MTQFSASIKDILSLTPDVMHIILSPPEEFMYVPGQFVSIVFNHAGVELRRPYSIASRDQNTIELCVKDVNGPCSQFLRTVSVGDALTLLGPFGRFLLPAEGDVVFISTGVGIAPFRSMIAAALADNRHVTLIAGYRTEKDILYHEEFLSYHKNFKYLVCLSGPESSDFKKGYVQDLLGEVPPSFQGHFLICGVHPMVQAVRDALLTAGFEKKNIHMERFT
jgi:ferredoxin-NADP reductase